LVNKIALDIDRGGDGLGSLWKSNEEGVTLGVDLSAVPALYGLSYKAMMESGSGCGRACTPASPGWSRKAM